MDTCTSFSSRTSWATEMRKKYTLPGAMEGAVSTIELPGLMPKAGQLNGIRFPAGISILSPVVILRIETENFLYGEPGGVTKAGSKTPKPAVPVVCKKHRLFI